MDAREENQPGFRLLRRASQLEAVADEVGQVLDFAVLVVVRQDDRALFLLQPRDLGFQVLRHGATGRQPLNGASLEKPPVAVLFWGVGTRLY